VKDDPPVGRDDGAPDTRYLLANERTLLAWIRTGLALMAGGGAVFAVSPRIAGRAYLAVILVILGVAASFSGALRFRQTDRAIRGAGALPTPRAPYLLAASVAAVGVVLAVAIPLARS
jgi:putative membrane protein